MRLLGAIVEEEATVADSAQEDELFAHLESVLGPIQAGWSVDPYGRTMPFQVVQFARGTGSGDVAYATLGLSRHALRSRVSGRSMRQELLILAPEGAGRGAIARLLFEVGTLALDSHEAFLRGDTISPRSRLSDGTALTEVYVTLPVYFPDSFATVRRASGDVVIAWLVPVTEDEAAFVERRGWDAFEDLLVRQDPDLVDFERSEVELGRPSS